MDYKRLALASVTVAALATITSGCGQPEPVDFTADTENGFLTACTRQLDDTRLTNSICRCVFDETLKSYDFEEFAQLDSELLENPEQPLPEDLTAIVAKCVVEEAEL